MRKKFCITLLLFVVIKTSCAQQTIDTSIQKNFNQTINKKEKAFKRDNIFLLGKIWGFLKYYHPTIAAGKYNWDRELIDFLPVFVNATSIMDRSKLLEDWINKFGEIPICASCNDSLLKNAKLTPDFSWINQSNFSKPLVQKLKYIQTNRIQNNWYYIKVTQSDGINLLQFPHELVYNNLAFPNDSYSLLALFKFWNAIEYWYPYKYNLPKSWNVVLKEFIPKMIALKNGYEYTIALEELVTCIHDSHGSFQSPLTNEVLGKYHLPFATHLVQNKLLVTSILNDSLANMSHIKIGDIIESIDDLAITTLIKKAALTCPASNDWSLRNNMSFILGRSKNKQSQLMILRKGQRKQITTYNFLPKLFQQINLNPPYFSYQKDSALCMLKNNIGYINVGNFKRNDSLVLKDLINRSKSLIIDNRQNQDEQKGTGGGDIIGKYIQPQENNFVKFSFPQPSYPGVFTLTSPTNMGVMGDNKFKGRIIVLINERTMSVGEFITMAYQKAFNAKTLGTTTSGADGNVTYMVLPGNFLVQFTGLGVYYPDGKETQRVGIHPDIVVPQTINGYLSSEDEQLDKAIKYLSKEN